MPFGLYSGRLTWISKFRVALAATTSLDDIESLLKLRVEGWRGRKLSSGEDDDQLHNSSSLDDEKGNLLEELLLDFEALSSGG